MIDDFDKKTQTLPLEPVKRGRGRPKTGQAMPDFTPEQTRIVARLDRALKDAASTGLALRVFDGAVLMLREEALDDPRYGEFGPEASDWIDEHTKHIAIGLNADGGSGT